MDATCNVQDNIHVFRLIHNMCPGFWVHIILHPKAQNKLMESFNELSKRSQIFITTHSPYLLKLFNKDRHQLSVFYKDGISSKFIHKDLLNLFGVNSPSCGEINYFAFDVPSVEFHNELYGFLQAKAIGEDNNNYGEEKFDSWLNSKGIPQNEQYKRLCKNGTTKDEIKTLPTKIRNIIHHPENKNNSYNDKDLKKSTEELIGIIKTYY